MENYQEVNEINLNNLIFYCIKRWRWIVVCMVFLAIVAGVYKYQVTIVKNVEKKELQLQQEQQPVTESAGGEAMTSEPIVFEDPLSSAVTFALFGMVGGICLVCLVLCMKYTMSGKLQDESNFQRKFGMPLLGIIRRVETKKRWFSFVDRGIRRLEEGPYKKISRNEQIKIAAVNVQAALQKNPEEKIKRVMLAGTIAVEDAEEICEQLVGGIGDVTFSPYRQIIFHASALKKLECYEGVLFIEKKGESYEKLILQEKDLAIDRDVRVLGTIIC